jgi:hypothetical protein
MGFNPVLRLLDCFHESLALLKARDMVIRCPSAGLHYELTFAMPVRSLVFSVPQGINRAYGITNVINE